MNMSYRGNDKHGMYKGEGATPGPVMRHGPGPGLTGGGDMLIGNDALEKDREDSGSVEHES
jgi:hypothetical protein